MPPGAPDLAPDFVYQPVGSTAVVFDAEGTNRPHDGVTL